MVVVQFESEFPIYLEFVAGVGGAQDRQQSAQGVDQLTDFIAAHALGWAGVMCGCGELSEQGRSFTVDIAAPRGNHRGVCPGFQGGAVFGEFAVAFGDRLLQQVRRRHRVGLGGFELGECVFDSFGFEYLRVPGVDGVGEYVFLQEDVEGVFEVVVEGVFAG
ncbi:hypothetical protein ABZV58_19360 [Nocardia sp. NPDC004654]|uniref:hypothetical protein n=1 Tax=Nocardia sp. NPDC004654 TaxID=3154776 RepID=UPI0033A62312